MSNKVSFSNNDVSLNISTRFIPGEKSDEFHIIKESKPIFSFHYISQNKSQFCFNYNEISKQQYGQLIDGLKEISAKTYDEIEKNWQRFHFHDVQFDDTNIQKSKFYKCIYGNGNSYDENDITAYQIKTHNDSRVIGFIYKSIFYLVMFDVNHKAYDRDRDKKKRNVNH